MIKLQDHYKLTAAQFGKILVNYLFQQCFNSSGFEIGNLDEEGYNLSNEKRRVICTKGQRKLYFAGEEKSKRLSVLVNISADGTLDYISYIYPKSVKRTYNIFISIYNAYS